MKQFEKDLTQGPVTKQLFSFCLPFLLSNFLQAMYGFVDMLTASWFAGPATVSGVSNGGQITLVCMNLVIGFSVGGTVLVSQYFGAGKRNELSRTIGTMFTSLLVMAVVTTVLVLVFAHPLLRFINTPGEAYGEAYLYMAICVGGIVFTFGYNAVSAVLRGMGDSKNPLYFVLIAGIINTLLDVLFVGPFGWGAVGVASATVIAQALSLVLAVWYLRRRKFVFGFKLADFRVDTARLKQILKVGLPTSVQQTVVGLSFLFMLALVNDFGVDASAAVGIVGKFNGFAILPALAMASSISSMAAQNIGAGKLDRARATMHAGIRLTLPICIAFFLLSLFAPEAIMGIFTDVPGVVEHGVSYIRYLNYEYLLLSFLFCINGLLMGAGLTTFTMINGLISSILLRVPLAYLFGITFMLGVTGIGLAAPAAALGALVMSFVFYRTGKWKRKRLVEGAEVLDSFF